MSEALLEQDYSERTGLLDAPDDLPDDSREFSPDFLLANETGYETRVSVSDNDGRVEGVLDDGILEDGGAEAEYEY